MRSRGARNIVITVLCQLTMLACGIALPKITIMNLGSEANGFLSTINEIFVYISLIEGGLGLALLNSLYKSIKNNDKKSISDVLTAARLKYRKISIVYLVVTFATAVIFPLCLKTELSYIEMMMTIIVHGAGGAGTMYLSSSICQFLIASGYNYIKEVNHLVNYLLTSLSKIALILLTKNIVIVTLTHTVFCLIEGVIYQYYIKTKFPLISFHSKTPQYEALSEQKYFLIHQISGAIFTATDLFIISIFCSLADSSIYAVYALIFNAIATVMNSVFNSMKYLLGEAYADSLERYKKIHDIFETMYLATMFALYFVAFYFSNAFVSIYTEGADINYSNQYLPLLFAIVKLLSSCRTVCNNTHNIAHRSKENIIPTIIESCLNLIVSLLLVRLMGIYGVLIGTIVALTYRTNQTIIYTNQNILNRTSWKTYRIILIYTALVTVLYSILSYIKLDPITGYGDFAIKLIIVLCPVLLIYFVVAILINQDIRTFVKQKIRG